MLHFVLIVWILAVRGGTTSAISSTVPENLTTPSTLAGTTTEITLSPTRRLDDSTLIKNPLTGLGYGVSSGNIMISSNKTVTVSNFHFDGTVPDTYFLVGVGNKISEDGTKVSVSGDAPSPLSTYYGQDITLTLPDSLTVDDIDWLALWSFTFNKNLGYVFLKKVLSQYPPQTFGLKNEVTSGPVVLVNKKTLFVPNFHYEGGHENVYFWVGNGSEPDSSGVAIPDENGSLLGLQSYSGQNLLLNLPNGITTDNIEYFAVWSKNEEISLGMVPIPKGLNVPEASKRKSKGMAGLGSADTSFTMRVPKCCAYGSVLTFNGCEEKNSLEFQPNFKVYEHNTTHFRNESLNLSMITFEPFTSSPDCPSSKFPLDEESEEFAILQNGSLLVKGPDLSGILPIDFFCLENVEYEDGSFVMKILVCTPEQPTYKAMFCIYVILTAMSTICFVITLVIYVFLLEIKHIHSKCFVAYIGAMTMTFLSLTIVQLAKVENVGCEVLGFLFQFFMITSFTLLTLLCFDIYLIIKYIANNIIEKERTYLYLGIGLGVPIGSLIISLCRNLTPDVPNSFFKPQYQSNSCNFDLQEQRIIYFYGPIIIAIIVSAVCLVLAKVKINQNDKENGSNYYWITDGTTYKFNWRKYIIITLTSMMWFVEAMVNLYIGNAKILMAIDMVEASQGIIVLFLFVTNKCTRTKIRRKIADRKKKKKNKISNNHTAEELMLT